MSLVEVGKCALPITEIYTVSSVNVSYSQRDVYYDYN